MRPTRDFTAEQASRDGAGLHYTSAEWRTIAAEGDWQGEWPEIDRRGILTGNAIGSVENYLNVDEEAMIPVSEAVAGGWVIDREEGSAEPPPPVMVEVASSDETIRICGGLEDFASMEHHAMEAACEAYNRAATAALDGAAGRLHPCEPRGRRLLHSQWMGAKWEWSRGAVATMTAGLTPEECAAIDAAHDAGLAAARCVIERADAEDSTYYIDTGSGLRAATPDRIVCYDEGGGEWTVEAQDAEGAAVRGPDGEYFAVWHDGEALDNFEPITEEQAVTLARGLRDDMKMPSLPIYVENGGTLNHRA